MWSLTAAWGGFGGMVAKDWKERDALDRGDVRRGVRRGVAGARPARVSRGSIRRCRRPASTTSSWCCRATRRPSRCSRRPAAVRRRRLAERQVPVRRHRSEDRPAGGARRDRSRAARRPRARPRRRRPGARHAARRRLREPLQLLRPQLQGDPADRRRGPRDRRPAARPQDQDAGRRAGAGVDVHAHRDEHRAAHAEPLPAAQRRAGLRRRQAGRHEGRRAARPRSRRGRGGRSGRRPRLRRRVAADPPRGRRRSPSRSGSRSCSSIWCSRRSSRASAIR